MSAASKPAETRACVYVRVPASLKRMVERDARAAGLSVNAYTVRCLEASLLAPVAARRLPRSTRDAKGGANG